jgi:hypothetical protein
LSKVSAFCYSWPTHINGMYVCVLGIPKGKFSKQMKKKILSYRIIRIKHIFSGVYWCITWTKSLTNLHKSPKGVYIKFVSALFTHAWTLEKKRLILIILKFNIVDIVLFLHIPGLKIAQIKILQNVVDDFGTLTTWRHMKTSSLKRKDQALFGFIWLRVRFNFNKI